MLLNFGEPLVSESNSSHLTRLLNEMEGTVLGRRGENGQRWNLSKKLLKRVSLFTMEGFKVGMMGTHGRRKGDGQNWRVELTERERESEVDCERTR